MRKKNISLLFMMALFLSMLFPSCILLQSFGISSGGYSSTDGGISLHGRYYVNIEQCTGSASTQEIEITVQITNNGPNEFLFVGGSSDGTLAIDIYGNSVKPYNSAGEQKDLPSGVPVKVLIKRMGPIPPGTPTLRFFRLSLGNSKNIVEFRQIPITWTN